MIQEAKAELLPPKKHVKTLTKQERVDCFRSLFKGRTDIFAKRWMNKDGTKSGYSPACQNEWVPGVCKKAERKKCDQCSYIPLTEAYTEKHLRGQMTIGLYPLMKENTSYFLAVDFDEADWEEQTRHFVEVCGRHGLPVYVERSRSGNGAHVWFFFADPYPAYKSRQVAFALLREAGVIDELTKADSFDRLFPNQDYLSGKGFGNLIALPLQYEPRQKGNSVFVDVANKFTPYTDQWEVLTTIQRITPDVLNLLFEGFTDSAKDQTFSDTLELTVRNYVIIPKGNLPKKLTDFLTDQLHFVNSQYIINQRLGRNTYKIERYFKAIENDETSILVPRGFLNRLTQFLDENGLGFQIRDERLKLDEIELSPTYKLMPHQRKALRAFEDGESGILVSPAGSGKTIMGLELIARKKQPALIIVHKKQILEQWVERIEDFLDIPKKHIGQLSGSKKKVKTPITVAMVQSLSRREDLSELSKTFGTVLVDECHHVPAKMFRKVITQFNPYYLFGLTATPQRKHNDEKLIFVYLGDIIHEVPNDYQHEEPPAEPTLTVRIRETTLSVPFRVKTDQYHLLYKTLTFDSTRNELIVKDISEYAQRGYKCLVLTERKEHVEMLDLYLKRDFEVITLTGDLGVRKRREVEKQIHSGHFHILIATGQLIGEGTDFPNLDCLFLVFPFSFEGKLVQYIGRIQRGESPSGRFIFDYRDSNITFLENQFKKRNRYYKKLAHSVIVRD